MKSTLFNRVAIVFVALSFFISALSCVEQEYEISEENLNTEVTIFQEGVQIPIGSTAELKVKDLLETFGWMNLRNTWNISRLSAMKGLMP